MDALQVLVSARGLVATPECWCKNALARDEFGSQVRDPNDQDACAWDCAGALIKASGRNFAAWEAADTTLGVSALWNDNPARTHDEVLAAFDRAIAIAQALL
jgi:hypothetical protein